MRSNRRFMYYIFFALFLSVNTATAETSFSIESESGDPIGQGSSFTFQEDEGYFIANPHYNGLDSGVTLIFAQNNGAAEFWSIQLDAPNQDRLAVGVYQNANLIPYNYNLAGLAVRSRAGGCSWSTLAEFEVHQVEYRDDDTIERFSASFTQQCQGATGVLRGSFKLNTLEQVEISDVSISASESYNSSFYGPQNMLPSSSINSFWASTFLRFEHHDDVSIIVDLPERRRATAMTINWYGYYYYTPSKFLAKLYNGNTLIEEQEITVGGYQNFRPETEFAFNHDGFATHVELQIPEEFQELTSLAYVLVSQIHTFAQPRHDSWQNPVNRYDVNADGVVSPADMLMVINKLNSTASSQLSATRPVGASFFDVNGDGVLSPADYLLLSSQLN